MILAKQVTLEPRHRSCIWCERRFLPHGFKQDRTVDFGPVERSEEHIFPQNVFGRLVTLDLCKDCNDMFGSRVDHHLLRDERVITAAAKTGIDNKALLKRFHGNQSTHEGRKFQVTLQNGNYRITPRFADLMQLSVGSVGGKILQNDLVALKHRLGQEIRRKMDVVKLPTEHELRIIQLIDAIAKNPDQVHYDPVLGEGFKPTALSTSIKVQMRSDPWITDWCVAKMLFTTTACMMPNPYFLYLQPVQNYLRTFVREGLAREYTGTGKSIFASGSDEQHAAKHSITISATQTRYKGVVRFFGSAWWRFSCDLKPVRAPLQKGFTIEMLNPFGSEDSMLLAKVMPL